MGNTPLTKLNLLVLGQLALTHLLRARAGLDLQSGRVLARLREGSKCCDKGAFPAATRAAGVALPLLSISSVSPAGA